MVIPTWIEFLVWLGTGAFVVPLLELLKKLPAPVGPAVEKSARMLAIILVAAAPVISQVIGENLPNLDAWLWTAIYALAMFGLNQVVYRVGKKTGKIL